MLHCYPYVPVGGEMALNCAILTYDGTAYFGFSGDVHAAPDLGLLEKLLQQSFEELKDAVEAKPLPKTKETKRIKKARAQVKVATTKTSSEAQPAAVRVTIPVPPATSSQPALAVAPVITEDKVLTQLIAS
jgi:hypothetical protein